MAERLMRKANIECSVCKKPLYKRPFELKKNPHPVCIRCRPIILTKAAKIHQRKCFEDFIKRWKAGQEFGLKGKTSTSAYIRRYLFERCVSKCEKCQWSEINPVTKKVPLEINHINGNFRDNREENLELICPNCHSLTPTYRSLNKLGRPRKNLESPTLARQTILKTVAGKTDGSSNLSLSAI